MQSKLFLSVDTDRIATYANDCLDEGWIFSECLSGSDNNQTVEMEQITSGLLNCPNYYTTE